MQKVKLCQLGATSGRTSSSKPYTMNFSRPKPMQKFKFGFTSIIINPVNARRLDDICRHAGGIGFVTDRTRSWFELPCLDVALAHRIKVEVTDTMPAIVAVCWPDWLK